MVAAADRGKKSKVAVDADHFDGEVLVSIEKLQEVQDELEKGSKMVLNGDNLPMLNATEHEVAIHTIWERFYDVQDELDEVNEEASDKVLEVEQEYNKIRRPVYVRRNEIIKAIPDFWLTAFLSHPALGDLLNEEDQQIFRHLEYLDVEDFKDVKSGYSITFAFKSNPYFEDAKLTKTFTFSDDGAAKITGTDIKWKEGMGPANGANHDKKGNKRPPSDESFFTWFSETQQKDSIDGLHDEVAELIKEDLWPNPLKFFNNEAGEEDSDEEDDDEDNDDDAEEEDDDDDDEDGDE